MTTCNVNQTVLPKESEEQVFGYAECEPFCSPPVNITHQIITGENGFDEIVSVGSATSPYTVIAVSTEDWAFASVDPAGVRIIGTPAQPGQYKLIYTISNVCGSAILVVDISIVQGCVPVNDIVSDFSIISGLAVHEIQLPVESTVASSSLPLGLAATIYGNTLTITGDVWNGLSQTYSLNMTSACGDYVVSGYIYKCQQLFPVGSSGSATMEQGAPASFCWQVLGANAQLVSTSNIPSGLGVTLAPYPGGINVCVSGTPTSPVTETTMVVTVKNECSTSELRQKITPGSAACTAISLGATTGDTLMVEDVLYSYCQLVTGSNIVLQGFSGVPIGLSLGLVDNMNGTYSVCVSGTPSATQSGIPENGLLTFNITTNLQNSCSNQTVNFTLYMEREAVVDYTCCAGLAHYDPATRILSVCGVVPGSIVTIDGGPAVTVTELLTDAQGGGAVTLNANPASGDSLILTHPTCALVLKAPLVAYTTP